MSRSSLLAAAVIAGSVAVPHVNVQTDCRASASAPAGPLARDGGAGPGDPVPRAQALSRYPVLNIQVTTPSETARNSAVTPRLAPRLTSPTP
jgi:hypothetical protein